MKRSSIKKEVINGYRANIFERYQFEYLKSAYDIPDFVDEALVEKVRAFFLEYVYPDAAQREELDEAFQSLDHFIKEPGKLLRILMDATGLLLRYGRHLPSIFKTGLQALQSFRKASLFEQSLIDSAKRQALQPPYDSDEIESLIRSLPYKDVKDFIHEHDVLFDALIDVPLMERILKIMDTLVSKMKKRKNIYAATDIEGIETGKDLLAAGLDLVKEVGPSRADELISFIKKIETDTIEKIFQ